VPYYVGVVAVGDTNTGHVYVFRGNGAYYFLKNNPQITNIRQLTKIVFSDKMYEYWIKDILDSIPVKARKILKEVIIDRTSFNKYAHEIHGKWLIDLGFLKNNGSFRHPLMLPILKDYSLKKDGKQRELKLLNNKINDIINFTGNITDELGLLYENITYNMSGILTKFNYTLSGISAQISNVTKITTARGSVINFTMYATDANNNVKQNSTLITVINTLPVNTVTITPSSATDTDNLTCNGAVIDADGDTLFYDNTTYWFRNGWLNDTDLKNKSKITIGNYTANDKINCIIAVYDGFDWSLNYSSSNITIGDATSPIISSISLSASSITDGNELNLTTNCSDTGSNIQSINFTLINPNGAYLNRSSPTHFTIPASQTNYILNYTIFQTNEGSVIGEWNITNIGCKDSSGNSIYNTTTNGLEFIVNAASQGGGGTSTSGGGGGATIEADIIVLGNLSLVLRPPIIASNFLYTPFKKKMQRFSIELVPNKEIDRCISPVFECIVKNNIITVALNYSNDSIFISKVESKVTLIDKAGLAKTIDASVRFINLAIAMPFAPDVESTKYLIFRLSNGSDGSIKGIRVWFIMVVLIFIGTAMYLLHKEGYF